MTYKEELLSIMDTVKTTGAVGEQSPAVISQYIMNLTAMIARTGEIQATLKGELHKAREKAYRKVVFSLGAQEKKIGPMLIKDYVNDTCAEENEVYELAERTNRAVTHTLEGMRSILSYLKEEFKTSNYVQ